MYIQNINKPEFYSIDHFHDGYEYLKRFKLVKVDYKYHSKKPQKNYKFFFPSLVKLGHFWQNNSCTVDELKITTNHKRQNTKYHTTITILEILGS